MSSPGTRTRAAILAIGDEVLRGEVANTNAAFLSERLFEIGIEVGEQLVVSDDPTAIRTAFRVAGRYLVLLGSCRPVPILNCFRLYLPSVACPAGRPDAGTERSRDLEVDQEGSRS